MIAERTIAPSRAARSKRCRVGNASLLLEERVKTVVVSESVGGGLAARRSSGA